MLLTSRVVHFATSEQLISKMLRGIVAGTSLHNSSRDCIHPARCLLIEITDYNYIADVGEIFRFVLKRACIGDVQRELELFRL